MRLFIFCGFIIVLYACRDKYESPVNSPVTGYLVVEGYINTGKGGTSISLSRVNQLTNPAITRVRAARVQVEADNNEVYVLPEKANGVYVVDQLVLDNGKSYRLRIKTSDNKEYLSAFMKARITPAIDSVSWTYDNNGVQIYANTHDPGNNTKYYRWEYEQTWEIHSSITPILKYISTPIPGGFRHSVDYILPSRGPDTSKFRCWQNNNSNTIVIGSTAKLAKDIISMPMTSITKGGRPLSVLYSILIRQFAISKEEYEFLDIMKKNTEITGSIFDAQPSQLKGNIQCLTNPAEPVVGYVGVSSLEQQRIFISNRQVPEWGYNSMCYELWFANHTDSIVIAMGLALVPTGIHTFRQPDFIDTFYAAPGVCIDCTLVGSNKKPDFWP